MGSGFAADSPCRYDSNLFGKFVVQMISARAATLGWLRREGLPVWDAGRIISTALTEPRSLGWGVVKCNDLGIKTGNLRKYLYRCTSLNLKNRDY
jgi:hypothetical protein